MRYYPLAIDTKNKKFLLIGGGRASYLKLKSLINTCAQITVISEEFCCDVSDMKNIYGEKLTLIRQTVDKNYINIQENYDIAFVCTDDKELNRSLCEYFKDRNIMVMTSDDKELSDFITSSILEIQNITVAVNTNGRSPTASKAIIEEIRKILTDEFVDKIDMICKSRDLLKTNKAKMQDEIDIKLLMDEIMKYDKEELINFIKVNEIKSTGEDHEYNSRYERQ